MKKGVLCLILLLTLLLGLWTAKSAAELAAEKTLAARAVPSPEPLPEITATAPSATVPEETASETLSAEPVPAISATDAPETRTEPTLPSEPLLTFTEEEQTLLLKLAMSERGSTGCVTCMALVMRTALNRVESPKFSSTIKGVIYAQDQFTPVMDGSFEKAQPDWLCEKALELVKQGWDESQGALYYEWCEGESWHSRNLNLLLQHCDTRFYN